jgi:hypothetical protein
MRFCTVCGAPTDTAGNCPCENTTSFLSTVSPKRFTVFLPPPVDPKIIKLELALEEIIRITQIHSMPPASRVWRIAMAALGREL